MAGQVEREGKRDIDARRAAAEVPGSTFFDSESDSESRKS